MRRRDSMEESCAVPGGPGLRLPDQLDRQRNPTAGGGSPTHSSTSFLTSTGNSPRDEKIPSQKLIHQTISCQSIHRGISGGNPLQMQMRKVINSDTKPSRTQRKTAAISQMPFARRRPINSSSNAFSPLLHLPQGASPAQGSNSPPFYQTQYTTNSPGTTTPESLETAYTPILESFGMYTQAHNDAQPSTLVPMEYEGEVFGKPPSLRSLRIQGHNKCHQSPDEKNDEFNEFGAKPIKCDQCMWNMDGQQQQKHDDTRTLGDGGMLQEIEYDVSMLQTPRNHNDLLRTNKDSFIMSKEIANQNNSHAECRSRHNTRSICGPHLRVTHLLPYRSQDKTGRSEGTPWMEPNRSEWGDISILPLKKHIGSGAMGHVYLVELLGRPYAVKLAVHTDAAACMYLRQGWQNLARLEGLYTSITGGCGASRGESTKTNVCSRGAPDDTDDAPWHHPPPRYFCQPITYLTAEWYHYQSDAPDMLGAQARPLTSTSVCAYIMEYIPNACQLTVLTWHFHRSIDPAGELRRDSRHVSARRIVDLGLHVASAHKMIACDAQLHAFDFNPKNILVSVMNPTPKLGQKPLSPMEITHLVFADPRTKFRVVAIDLDCSLTPPFTQGNNDELMLDWNCGRRVVYSCPHVPSIIAAYILAVLAKNKGQGQFLRSGLSESVAHSALCDRMADPTNFLHYLQAGETVCSETTPETENVSPAAPQSSTNLYQPLFLYPISDRPKDLPAEEHCKYGVRLIGQHANLQLLAFILCDLLDARSLHNVIISNYSDKLRALALPTDVCQMFSEKDQVISCLCFSALTRLHSTAIPQPFIFSNQIIDIPQSRSLLSDMATLDSSSSSRWTASPGTPQPSSFAKSRRLRPWSTRLSKSIGRLQHSHQKLIDTSGRLMEDSLSEMHRKSRSPPYSTKRRAGSTVLPSPTASIDGQVPWTFTGSNGEPDISVHSLSLWDKLEMLPRLHPRLFLPSTDLVGRAAACEMATLNLLLLQMLDPLPTHVLRHGPPAAVYDMLIRILQQLLVRLSR